MKGSLRDGLTHCGIDKRKRWIVITSYYVMDIINQAVNYAINWL